MPGVGGGPAPSIQTYGVMARLLAEPQTGTGQLGSSWVFTGPLSLQLNHLGTFKSEKQVEAPFFKCFLKLAVLCSSSES